jgi:ferredoxin
MQMNKLMEMSEREKYYFDKYNLIKDTDPKTCGGTGCCSTCMYRINNQNFLNDYCVQSPKQKG